MRAPPSGRPSTQTTKPTSFDRKTAILSHNEQRRCERPQMRTSTIVTPDRGGMFILFSAGVVKGYGDEYFSLCSAGSIAFNGYFH